jgi:hypothetical protein
MTAPGGNQPPGEPSQRSLRPTIAAAIGAIGAVAVVVAIVGAIALTDGEDGGAPTPSQPTVAPTVVPPRLGVDIDLRSGPSNLVAIVVRLPAGTELIVEGRDSDGEWLAVTVLGQPAMSGWVSRASVIGAPTPDGLALIASSPIPTAVPTAIAPVDGPDLVIASAVSRSNQLVVTLTNEGTTDVTGTILLAVNDEPPMPVQVKAGEPLIAGDKLEVLLEGEYVQRRGRVSIVASTDPPLEETDLTNNRLDAVIEPDQPNDLAIVNAVIADDRGHLVVSVRNNSSIPIAGSISVAVREVASNMLLGRLRLDVELLPDEVIDVEFEAIEELDFTRATVQLFSDALDDAIFANNTFPR